jgi:hypothetical protein
VAPLLRRPPPPLVAAAVFLVAVAGVLALLALPSPWDGLRPASCMPDRCFCERIRDSLVRQPINTLSGLLFLPVGVWILLSSERGRSTGWSGSPPNLLTAQPAYARLFGAATVLVGVGTALYHASLTFAGQTLDVFGMYLLVSFLLVYAVARHRPLSPRAACAGYAILNAGLLVLLVAAPGVRREVFAGLVVAALAAEGMLHLRRRMRMRSRYLAAAAGVLALGALVWTLDLRGTGCDPDALFQGHALWHAAGALATGLMFLYLRSERPATEGATDAAA